MKLEIRKDLRDIYNYLMKENIVSYLSSKDFKDFYEKNIDIKEIWKESENYANNMSFLLFSFRGRGELVDISLGIFLEKIINLGKEKFLEIILRIMKDFYRFLNREISFYEIHKSISYLNYTLEEIVECYNKM
jgi:hypothetical protein